MKLIFTKIKLSSANCNQESSKNPAANSRKQGQKLTSEQRRKIERVNDESNLSESDKSIAEFMRRN